MLRNAALDAAVGVLRAEGVPFRVERSKRHPALHYEVGGQKFIQVISKTSGDRKAALNAAADIRRNLRLGKSHVSRHRSVDERGMGHR